MLIKCWWRAVPRQRIAPLTTFGAAIDPTTVPGGIFEKRAGTIAGKVVAKSSTALSTLSLIGLGKNPNGPDAASRVLTKCKVTSGKGVEVIP